MATPISYFPLKDSGKVIWLQNFTPKISGYATALDIPASTISQLQVDTEAFLLTIQYTESVRNFSEALTAFRNQLRDGKQSLGSLPPAPAAPTLPSGARNDIFGRIRKLVQTIKSHPNYSESIGDSLRIIAPKAAESSHEWKPLLQVAFQAGTPIIKWKKGKSQGIKLWVDRGDGFKLEAINTIPDYTDRHPLPPVGQSAIWKYQAVYLLKDQEVGQLSTVLEVTVTGILQ